MSSMELLGFLPPMSMHEALQLPPLTLAFVGDAVHHLYVRTHLACTSGDTVHQLHLKASRSVMASAQAGSLNANYNLLTGAEQDIFRRGRNAKPGNVPKNASLKDYHDATGFEAVLGYLYLTNQHNRLAELLKTTLV